MKYIKKATSFTNIRDMYRLIFAAEFYILMKIFGIELELESEVVVLLSVAILGPMFCGFACPFGAAQYFMHRVATKYMPKQVRNLPNNVDKNLRYLKYLLLVYFMYLFVVVGINYFGDHMDMYKSAKFSSFFIEAKHLVVLGVALFIPFVFCRYLCWQKAFYNIINRFIKTAHIKRDEKTCVDCGKCDKVCPMSINISKMDKISGNDDCLSCFNCTDTDMCAKKSLTFHWLGRKVDILKFSVAFMTANLIISVYVVHYM